jgi:protein involved in polysaccharide export with SLBB domain
MPSHIYYLPRLALIPIMAIMLFLLFALSDAVADSTTPTQPAPSSSGFPLQFSTIPTITAPQPSTVIPAASSTATPAAGTHAPTVQPGGITPAATSAIPATSQFTPYPPPASVFGSQLFTGNFKVEQFSGFNPNYQISIGDKITLHMWGAVTLDGSLPVDPQGNIFIPNVGSVHVLGVRNGELNTIVEAGIRRVFHNNVGVYASLDAVQPVKVFVTGFVRQPGLYSGLSSDSVLRYIDMAGGVDPDRGSYLDVVVKRGEQVRKTLNLYDFLLYGKMDLIQMADGDKIVVGPRNYSVSVSGEVQNSYQFEMPTEKTALADVLSIARPKAGTTNVSILRKQGVEIKSEYHPLDAIKDIVVNNGDEVTVLSDKYPGTILVRINGAVSSSHAMVLPYGATMASVLARIVPNMRSNMEAVQLFRQSVAQRQKDMLLQSLKTLEANVLNTRSATTEVASLRTQEAQLVLQFIDRAKTVEPKGQVVLGSRAIAENTLLQDGDIINIPEITSVVMVHGEVLFPNALVQQEGEKADYYIQQAGGFSQSADPSRVIVLKQNGMFVEGSNAKVNAGDEIMVLPKVQAKSIEIVKSISQIIFQVAVAARTVILGK